MNLKGSALRNWVIFAGIAGFLLWIAVDRDDAPSAPAAMNASDTEEAGDTTAIRPSFNMDEAGALDLISQIGNEWKEPVFPMRHHDSLTDGQSISYNFKRRSVSLFTLPNGRVWRINLHIGWGDFCGTRSDIPHATAAFVKLLAPGTDPTPLFAGARSDTVAILATPTADIRVVGPCVTKISATAS